MGDRKLAERRLLGEPGAATPLQVNDGLNFMRLGRTAPFDFQYFEVGNEEYGSWEIDHHTVQHDPATYVAFALEFQELAAAIDPSISIGIDAGAPDDSYNDWLPDVLQDAASEGFTIGFISDHNYVQAPGSENDATLLLDTVSDPDSELDWAVRAADYTSLLDQYLGPNNNVQLLATEFNSVYADPGKQTTSLVNGLFVADSLGSLLETSYDGADVWDLRNGWQTGDNNSSSLYGWREGGDYGLLGSSSDVDPPSTGTYVPYPTYFAEQLASMIIQAGGEVVQASSSDQDLAVYAVLEASGHLDMLVINKSATSAETGNFQISNFTIPSLAQVWQYGETQDTAQSETTNGYSSLDQFTAALNPSGSTFSYSFPAYSMSVLDLGQVVSITAGPTITMPATASPVVVLGTTANLSVSATDPSGPSPLTYTWSTTASPLPGVVVFSNNGTNAAQSTTATFQQAGSYTFQVVVTDAGGLTATSEVSVTVDQTITSIEVSPSTATVAAGASRSLTAQARDQFGALLSPQPSFAWSIASGIGSINAATGVYVAPGGEGTATVQASSGGVRGLASVTVTAPATSAPPTAASAAATVQYTEAADWKSGFVGAIMITNVGNTPIASWTLAFVLPRKITLIWGATIVKRIGNYYLVRNEPSSGSIAPGQSTSFGFQGKPGRTAAVPTNYMFDGMALPQPAAPAESPSATAQFVVTSKSRKTFTATLSITNIGAAPIGGWALQFNFAGSITSIGGAAVAQHAGSRYVIRDLGTNGVIAPGQSVRVTFKGPKRKRIAAPTTYLLDGVPIQDPAGAG